MLNKSVCKSCWMSKKVYSNWTWLDDENWKHGRIHCSNQRRNVEKRVAERECDMKLEHLMGSQKC